MKSFMEVFTARKGEQAARAAWDSTFNQIVGHLPEVNDNDVIAYLESEWGGRMANEILAGFSVASQVVYRKARFMKHFNQIARSNNGQVKFPP